MSTRIETFTSNPMSIFFENDEFEAEEFEDEGFLSEDEEEEIHRGKRAASRGRSSRTSGPPRRKRLSPAAAAKRRKLQMMQSRAQRPGTKPKSKSKKKPRRVPFPVSGLTLWPGIFPQPQSLPQPTGTDQKSAGSPAGSSGPAEGSQANNQQGSEFNRWVQSSLNKILGLNLPVDGVIDVQTRSAIRSFQTKKGLPTDGVVGPPTERALTEALSQSSGAGAGSEGPPAGADAEPQGAAQAGADAPAAGGDAPPAGGEEPAKDSEMYEYFMEESPNYEDGGHRRGMGRRRSHKRAECNCPKHPSQSRRRRAQSETFEYNEAEYLGEDEGEFEYLGEREQEFPGEGGRDFEGEGQFLGEDEGEFEYLGEEEAEFESDETEFLGEEEFSFSGIPSSIMSWFKGTPSSSPTTSAPAPSYVPAGPPATPAPVYNALPTSTTGGLDIVTTRSGIQVARQIAAQVDALTAAAKADGVNLGGGGFRSPQKQIELRKKNCGPTQYDIYQKKSSLCSPPTAIPGQSNHERGLAIDFNYNGGGINSRSSPAFQWLSANAARFGLYNLPSEPWHWSVNGK